MKWINALHYAMRFVCMLVGWCHCWFNVQEERNAGNGDVLLLIVEMRDRKGIVKDIQFLNLIFLFSFEESAD